MATPTTPEQYQTVIAEIDARIIELAVIKAASIAAATANVSQELISDRLTEDLTRPYESEIYFLRHKRNLTSIAFAETFLV